MDGLRRKPSVKENSGSTCWAPRDQSARPGTCFLGGPVPLATRVGFLHLLHHPHPTKSRFSSSQSQSAVVGSLRDSQSDPLKLSLRDSHRGAAETSPAGKREVRLPPLASLSGLRTQYGHELGCRSQMQLSSDVAGVGAEAGSSNLTLAWEPPYAVVVAPKSKKKKKRLLRNSFRGFPFAPGIKSLPRFTGLSLSPALSAGPAPSGFKM